LGEIKDTVPYVCDQTAIMSQHDQTSALPWGKHSWNHPEEFF